MKVAMNKILDEKEFAVLRRLQKYAEGAVIAGGSVRDMIFGLPYNDVDIFYSSSAGPKGISYCQFVDECIPEALELTCKDVMTSLSADFSFSQGSQCGPNIHRVVQVVKEDGTKYQLISLDTGPVNKHIKANFDLNCVKVFHDGIKLHRTQEFEAFFQSRELNSAFEHAEALHPGSLARVAKILNRYTDFNLTIGERLKGFINWHEKNQKVNELRPEKKKAVKRPAVIPTGLYQTYSADMQAYAASIQVNISTQNLNAQLQQTQGNLAGGGAMAGFAQTLAQVMPPPLGDLWNDYVAPAPAADAWDYINTGDNEDNT